MTDKLQAIKSQKHNVGFLINSEPRLFSDFALFIGMTQGRKAMRLLDKASIAAKAMVSLVDDADSNLIKSRKLTAPLAMHVHAMIEAYSNGAPPSFFRELLEEVQSNPMRMAVYSEVGIDHIYSFHTKFMERIAQDRITDRSSWYREGLTTMLQVARSERCGFQAMIMAAIASIGKIGGVDQVGVAEFFTQHPRLIDPRITEQAQQYFDTTATIEAPMKSLRTGPGGTGIIPSHVQSTSPSKSDTLTGIAPVLRKSKIHATAPIDREEKNSDMDRKKITPHQRKMFVTTSHLGACKE